MHDPEPLVVAPRPLEVVQQRPDEVAPHVGAVRDGVVYGSEVVAQVADPVVVVDGPVDEHVGGGHAVLGHPHRQTAVALHAQQQVGQPGGDDRPAHHRLGSGDVDEARPVGAGEGLPGAVRRGDPCGVVVVDPHGVEPRADLGLVTGLHERPVRQALGRGDQVGGVAAAEHGVEEDPVRDQVDVLGRREVLLAVGGRLDLVDVEGDREVGGRREHAPQRAHGASVGEVEVVRGPVGQRGRRPTRGVLARRVAEVRRAPRLVQRGHLRHAVAELLAHHQREVHEPVRQVARQPAALPAAVEGLRQVPVVERHQRAGCRARASRRPAACRSRCRPG